MSAEPHKNRRAITRQLDESARLMHAQADQLVALTAEFEASERRGDEASGRWGRLVFELEHAFGNSTKLTLTWDEYQQLLARAGEGGAR